MKIVPPKKTKKLDITKSKTKKLLKIGQKKGKINFF